MSDSYSEHLDVRRIRDVTVVGFKSRRILDATAIHAIATDLDSFVEKRGRMLLNFENVDYVSDVAIGKISTLHKIITSTGRRLSLCNIAPEILEVIKITKLDTILRIEP